MTEDKPRKETSYLPRSWGATSKTRRASEAAAFEPEAEDSRHDEIEVLPVWGSAESPGLDASDDLPEASDSEEASPAIKLEEPVIPCGCPCPQAAFAGDPADADSEQCQPWPEETPSRVKVNIAGIRFGYACKIYNFDAGDMELEPWDWVIVKTEKGVSLGQVAMAPRERDLDAAQLEGLRKIVRKAGKVDFDQKLRCSQREAEAYAFCLERIDTLELPMKLVAIECFFDGSKYVFYFTAEGRVDFRELVKQLVARFPVRIEMRQIGVRHEAKMIGGLACCGQELCCSRFLTDFRPVSVKMAKNQNLSLNPTKISGVCGRLMCCLAYEHETYEQFKKGLPRVGKTVRTITGQEGVVVKHNPLVETICIRLADESTVEISREELLVESDTAGSQDAFEDEEECKVPDLDRKVDDDPLQEEPV